MICEMKAKFEELELNDNISSRELDKPKNQMTKFDDMTNDFGDDMGKRLATLDLRATYADGRANSTIQQGLAPTSMFRI